ncbi:filamentous hemagglutinin N-terminal domain-containing protein [Sphingosinicella sp. BN140058]|uniref:two-partner secretion domain-containing protein n=1 Tax=Sphingosinicella sp. BN140058 TaxID=1892855 RepID=UPI0010137117|nr:filamentous hemagglutinin N-terminal domain-containing protein [Sphingosinicella sp. BN140058]QAY77221.1 filamentous hemagglutinin N-terminal domain-containing protein [Sphingosinicella sp. BN140058]
MKALLAAAMLLATGGRAIAQAPAATTITPDTAGGLALGTVVTRSGSVASIDGGQVSGANLFHSFSHFDVAAGDTARWTHAAGNADAIANVVNRVTGGDPSRLFGTLDSSALPNADFYFLNPAGVIFGAEARLNVPAAAHFSTAGTLRFADGTAFIVATPSGSTLSMAAPEAFGFLGNEGAILVDGTNAALLPDDSTLSLSAADIQIRDATLTGGGIRLHGAGAGASIVPLSAETPGSGSVSLDNSFLITTATAAARGEIVVAGGDVSLNGSALSAYSSPDAAGGAIDVTADTLTLLEASNLMTTGIDGTSAGDMTIAARRIDLRGGSVIASRSTAEGAPGTISLTGEQIRLSNADIVSEAFGSGDAGVVHLAGRDSVTLEDLSSISTDSNGSGDGGAVLIETSNLRLADSFISADALGEGDAGGVLIDSENAELVRSYMTSDSYDTGDGGLVQLNVPGTLALRDESYLTSNAYSQGDSGGVLIGGGTLLLDRSSILASASGDGEAILVGIDLSDRLRLENGARIASNTSGRGEAGGILIEAPRVELVGGAIASEALGEGDGGLISIDASHSVTLEGGATLSSDSRGAGDAGGIAITTPSLRVADSRISSDGLGDGDGGDLAIDVAGALVIDDGTISAGIEGKGLGGDITIAAREIEIGFGGISANSGFFASGDGGDVTIRTDSLAMKALSSITSNSGDRGNGGNVVIQAGRLTMDSQATITSRSHGSGNGGSVSLRGGSARMTDSWIDSDAFGAGNGGAVTVELASLEMLRSRISSEAGDVGNAGTVDIRVSGSMTLDNTDIGTSTAGSGAAGDLTIEAGTLQASGRTLIGSDASGEATGPSGNVEIVARALTLTEGSTITTSSVNSNPAGSVGVEAEDLLVSGTGSQIASENLSDGGGAAGNVVLSGARITIAEGGRLTTNSANGAAGNILIDMPPTGFLTLIGSGQPGAIETSSGPGTGGLIIIASPFAIVSHGGEILALGESGGANVLISSNYFITSADRLNRVEVDGDLEFDNAIYDVSAGTVAPDLSVIDASGILRGQCPALRAGGRFSQLSVRPTGPYALPAALPTGTTSRPNTCR